MKSSFLKRGNKELKRTPLAKRGKILDRNSLKFWKKKVWNLQSEVIRREEKGICFTCDKQDNWKNQQTGHFIHLDCLDFVSQNIHCQCVGCNKYRHGNPIAYALALEKRYGYGICQKLRLLGDRNKPYKVTELQGLYNYYQGRLRVLNSQ